MTFISNVAGQVLMLRQRAGDGDQQLVVWDYHVVWLEWAEMGWRVFDPDHMATPDAESDPAAGVAADAYLRASFPALSQPYQRLAPCFRLIDAAPFLADFASDRSHMRTVAEDGTATWLQPPPPWPAPGRGHNLDRYIDMGSDGPGRVLMLPDLLRFVGAGAA